MRDKMPATAALIDDLRQAFGAELINAAIRRGIKGEANYFRAQENGETVGTAFDWPPGITAAAMVLERPAVDVPRETRKERARQ